MRYYRWSVLLCGAIGAVTVAMVVSSAHVAAGLRPATAGGYSLRFYGNGVDDIDRVKIRLDEPARPIDVGDGDFTIEWWMKALPGENESTAVRCGENDGWIYGNILLDRDIWGSGDRGDYGIALTGGRIAFGVNNGSSGNTLCGTKNVTDGAWHHVAVTRRDGGELTIFVDGTLDVAGSGPAGDISYRDGRNTVHANDPYLVIGAEKHDAGQADYPSYSGWLDELRISSTVRYAAAHARPTDPFVVDGATLGLYHFDEGSGLTLADDAGQVGGPSDGLVRSGGSPAGPAWSTDSPWSTPVGPDSALYLPLVQRP